MLTAIVAFLSTDVGQGLIMTAVTGLAGLFFKKKKTNDRVLIVANLAQEWFWAVKTQGDAKGWDNPTRWREFLRGMSKDLLAAGLKELTPEEVGKLSVLTQRLNWQSKPTARTTPLPLPSP